MRLLFGTAMSLAIAGYAAAADLPVYTKAPPPPMWSWTGFYIGGNVGYSVGRDPTNQTLNEPGGAITSVLITSDNTSPAGWLGGGQIGYNFQLDHNWLIGIEADIQGTGQKDTTCSLECGAIFMTVSQNLKAFGTVRGRLGFVHGDYLWYVTGGGAWGRVDSGYALGITGLIAGGPAAGALSTSTDRSGWVVGGGVETHLWGGWTGKLEYLYMDLGGFTDIYTVTGVGVGGVATVSVSTTVRDHIFRAGLNYKFDWAGLPYGTRY